MFIIILISKISKHKYLNKANIYKYQSCLQYVLRVNVF
jgi:hypothetical protein